VAESIPGGPGVECDLARWQSPLVLSPGETILKRLYPWLYHAGLPADKACEAE
jgi:hypothetical protein